MKFFEAEKCTDAQLKRILRYVKKMKRFDAYVELEQKDNYWHVKLFCERVHTDRMGNSAIVKSFRDK